MTIKLVSDSTCDLPAKILSQTQVNIVPINIQFNSTTYKENVDITATTFYKQIEQDHILPKTSQPSVGEFINMYQSLAPHANEIISIHVTSKLSGTYRSAQLAAEKITSQDINLKNKQLTIYPIDSLSGSAALGWMIYDAAKLIDAGYSASEIKNILEAKRNKISIFFAVDNLKFAQMSGRVGKLAGVLSSILNIKPIIGLQDGFINVHSKVRSNKAAMQRIVDLTKQQVKNNLVNIAVVHAQAPAKAEALLSITKNNLAVKEAFITDIAISLAVHFGPGTLGLVSYPTT